MKQKLVKIASVIGITVLLAGCFGNIDETVLLDEKIAWGSMKITKTKHTDPLGAWENSSVFVKRDIESDNGELFISWTIRWSCSVHGHEERRFSFWLEEKGWVEVDYDEFGEMVSIAEQGITRFADEKDRTDFILSVREMAGCV